MEWMNENESKKPKMAMNYRHPVVREIDAIAIETMNLELENQK